MASLDRIDRTRDGLQGYNVRYRVRQPDGTWAYRQKTVYGYDEAQKVRRDLAEKHEGRSAAPTTETSLADVAEWWLRVYGSRPRKSTGGNRVEPTSWDEAARTVHVLLEHFGDDRIFATITLDDLERAIADRRDLRTGQPVSPGTQDRMAGVIKAMFSDAVRYGRHTTNVAADLSTSWGHASEKGRRGIVPSVRDIELVAAALDQTDIVTKQGHRRPAYLNMKDGFRPSDRLWLLALTGARYSEACGLRTIDDHGDHLKLVQTWPRRAAKPRTYGKNNKAIRDLPVPQRLRPVLDRLTEFSDCGYLMTGPDGQPLAYETWRNALSRATKQTGVTLTSHWMRHVAASLWIKAGASQHLVMSAGGWASLDMVVKVYGHLWASDIVELGRNVDGLDWESLD